tara:strand:+ start:341 stop:1870 length:1530 start_codon:yes stop_codon:yes gene_type:complete
LIFFLKNKIFIYIIPFTLGLVTSFSLPPYNYFFINFLTFPILLFFLISNYKKGKWTSFIIGWMFGFGYFVSNLYWITNALKFEENFKVLIPIALILIPLFLGLFYGLASLTCSYFNLKKKFSSILIFSIFFSIIEFLRGFIFGGFPWNLISFSWVNYLPFLQLLSHIGTYTFNLLSLTIFLIPIITLFNYKKLIKITFLFFTAIILLINFLYGSFVIKSDNHLDQNLENFVIKIISPKIDLHRYFSNETPEKIILELIELSQPNSLEKTIFIFPEGVISNIYLEDLKNYSYLFSKNYSDNHKIIMGINSVEGEKIFNSMVVLDKDLNLLHKYKKNELVPFGEFLPFENFFTKIGLKKITQGYKSFSSHNERKIIEINNLSFVPLICYEIIYSGKINKTEKNFNIILNISEDGWFGNSVGPYQHFGHSIFRSIEEGKSLIRSANNGISAFINPKGKIINQIKSTEKGVIEIKSFEKTKKTLFSSFGNKIFFYFLLFYIILIFFLKKKENR